MNTLRPPLKTIAQKLRETNPIIHVAVGNCIAGRYIEIRPQDDGALTLITFTRDPANPQQTRKTHPKRNEPFIKVLACH